MPVDSQRWLTTLAGARKQWQAIHLLEARIVLLGLRRILCGAHFHLYAVLSMSDNLSCVLAFATGRAHDVRLRSLTMQVVSWILGCDVAWHVRHVRTHRNPVDEGSRLADRGLLVPGNVWGTSRWMLDWFLSRNRYLFGSSTSFLRSRRKPHCRLIGWYLDPLRQSECRSSMPCSQGLESCRCDIFSDHTGEQQ